MYRARHLDRLSGLSLLFQKINDLVEYEKGEVHSRNEGALNMFEHHRIRRWTLLRYTFIKFFGHSKYRHYNSWWWLESPHGQRRHTADLGLQGLG